MLLYSITMQQHNNAFSLVELSIVLVILGLLVGGVLSGQSLIHAAQLRSVTTEHDKYFTAIRTFKDKYFAVPGDMVNAAAFWGKDNATCPAATGTVSATGVCNGDGNGTLTGLGTLEPVQVWRHLAAGGLIEGNYTGTVPTSAPYSTPGVDHPASKLTSTAMWTYMYGAMVGSATNALGFTIGAADSPFTNFNWGPVMTPTDAWNIDTKIDDGKSNLGKVGSLDIGLNCSNNGTSAYTVANTGILCYLMFNDQ